MNVLVPYVGVPHPATVAAVELADANVRYDNTSAADGYWLSLMRRWARGHSFIVLEQDKVPEPGLLGELWECESPWCTARVAMRGTTVPSPYPSLSCTKFAAALIRQEPTLMVDVSGLDLGFGVREWSRLDMAIAGLLESRGWVPHYHDALVEHLHGGVAA